MTESREYLVCTYFMLLKCVVSVYIEKYQKPLKVCLLFSYTGEMSLVYLFTRYRFNFDEVEFSIFTTYAMATGLLGKQIASIHGNMNYLI